ncbi:unnamed protein product [Brassicogethes aeneus]|uniref:Uncharacterized protein n=1 Tax=Brassicogethes aeneus TaxID=1431903 RepID=A0A9P0FDL5_BRAAE|nr:unnamed protein product [Brassicogethes aeneus]
MTESKKTLSLKGPILVPKAVAQEYGKSRRYFSNEQEEELYKSHYKDVKVDVPNLQEVSTPQKSLEHKEIYVASVKSVTYDHYHPEVFSGLNIHPPVKPTRKPEEDNNDIIDSPVDNLSSIKEKQIKPHKIRNISRTASIRNQGDSIMNAIDESELFPELDIIPQVEVTESQQRIVNDNLKMMDEYRNYLSYGSTASRILPSRGLMPQGALEKSSSESSMTSFNSRDSQTEVQSVERKKCLIL